MILHRIEASQVHPEPGLGAGRIEGHALGGTDLPSTKAETLECLHSYLPKLALTYGAAMASEYNSRLLVPEVLVKGDQFAVIRARPSFDEILNRDTIPEWL